MAKFVPGQPIESREPVITAEGVEPGKHLFQLVVVDNDGNESRPAKAVVNVVGRTGPLGPIRIDHPIDVTNPIRITRPRRARRGPSETPEP